MKREFTKQRDAERIAASQFKEGTDVALVNHHWDRRIQGKRKVLKVYKNGNFLIGTAQAIMPSTQQWRPNHDGTTANRAGKREGFRDPEHLEIWTPAIEAELAERKAARKREARLGKIIEILGRRDAAQVVTDAQVAALEATLGLDSPAEDSPRSDGSMDTSE